MPYPTTVADVAAMFPAFVRGGTNQKPTDAQIQTFISDVQGELDAVLQRRFAEVIAQSANFAAWLAGLSADGIAILEKINRYGGAAQLGQVLATFGVASARDLGKYWGLEYERMKDDLDARDDKGRPLASGVFDHIFDSLARTETPRPGLKAIAGGDQPATQSPADAGSSAAFGRFDKRGT